MEIIGIIIIVIVIGFFIIPSKGRDNLTAHAARVPNCTCKNITRLSMDLDYDCPVHGDWGDD
jgi:hypothetical protein